MIVTRRQALAGSAAFAGTAALGAPAAAANFKLTVAAGHPPHFIWVKLLREFFLPEVKKRVGAAHGFEFTEGYGGTIAKIGGELEAIEGGIVDLGFVGTIFHAAKMALQNVSYVCPFGSDSIATVTGIVAELQKEIPAMNDNWTRHKQMYLAGAALDTYHLFTKFPVKSVADMAGKKILAPGPAANWIRGTGAVAVAGNLQTYFNDIKTGVAEGALVFTTGAWGAKVHEVAPHVTKVNFGSHFAGGISVNLDAFRKFPAEVQKVFLDVGAEYGKRFAEEQTAAAKALTENMAKAGAQIAEFPAAERKKWAEALPNVAKLWAEELDKKGAPGTAVLKGYMAKMKASGADIPRDWSA
jgi:TRAP-type C4-dicarboxylate transport system substrate-binding protein